MPLSPDELELVRAGSARMPVDDLVRRLLATLDARSGLALEMKRERGREGDVTDEQRDWLRWFASALGWKTAVGFGAEDALRKVASAGYPVRTTKETEG
jgi:hypothetical protein